MPRTLLALSVFLAACLTTGAAAGPTDVIRCNPLSPGHTFIESLSRIDTPHGSAGYLIDRPGHYLIAGDISVPAFDFGILVTSPGVTLDLGEHVLSAGPGTRAVVAMHGRAQLLLRNGSLAHREAAILPYPVSHPILLEKPLLEKRPIRSEKPALETPAPPGTVVDAGSGSLVLDHVELHNESIASTSRVLVSQGGNLTIASSKLRGAAVSVSVVVSSEAMVRVFDSRIEGASKGLEILGSGFGHVQGSTISGETALFVSGRVTVTHNMIRGGVRVIGGAGWFEDNDLIAMDSDHALIVEGSKQIISRNRIRGGRLAAIKISGAGNRVSGNRLQTRGRGILVGGESNLIERNDALVPAGGCGIEFTTADQHVYRDNVVRLRATPVCGEPNTEATTSGDAEPPVPLILARPRLGVPCAPPDAVLLPDGVAWSGIGPLVIDQPGYYLVTKDFGFPKEGGISITASDVVLDLGGHTVFCNFCPRLVDAPGQNITILDGTLDGGGRTLQMIGGGYARVWNIEGSCQLLSSSGCSALTIMGREEAVVEESGFESGSVSAVRSTVSGTKVDAIETGLSVRGSVAAHVEGSFIKGDRGLRTSEGASIVGNLVVARELKYEARTLLRHNFINCEDTRLEGEGILFEDNITRYHRLRSTGSLTMSRNSIFNDYGVEPHGSVTVEDNLILARARECGIELEDCGSSQVVVNNVIMGTEEGICRPVCP